MRTSPGQSDFERQQRINAAYREYQEGRITAAECMRRVKAAERK